jgi:Uma2 family endonuclease
MSTAVIDEVDSPTVADLLEKLGNVPANRVRLRPPPGQATERDVLEIHARTKRLCELIDGVLVEKATGLRESFLAMYIGQVLWNFVMPRRLGIITGEAGMMRLESGRVRMPDVAFISWDQLPERRVPREPIPSLYPDLAVEVLSDSNTLQEMEIKRRDYFAAGTRIVWQVDPDLRTIEVFIDVDQRQILKVPQSLDGGKVLPGFVLPLEEIFGQLDKQAPPANG